MNPLHDRTSSPRRDNGYVRVRALNYGRRASERRKGRERMNNGFSMTGLLRQRGDGRPRVTFIELFFDLVFVFAITQLSHHLLENLTLHGALQTLLLLLAVWRAWIDTAWFTNWFDPDRRPVRLTLIAAMLVSLIMSATLPDAFADRGLTFAAAYVTMQVGRDLFAVAALRDQPSLRLNFQRILCWAVASGVLWLAGALVHDTAREALWLAAVLVDYAAPASGFVTPGLGRSTTRDWTIAGSHLAERCQLFLIVALGESILVTGSTFCDLDHSASVVAALIVAFLGTVTFWWLYFDRSAEAAGEIIAATTDPGRLGRSGYTYFHLPMVAGVIVTAVGDELVITHPTGHADTATIATVVGGPALFLAGHLLFKHAAFGHFSTARPVALFALGILAALGPRISPLALSGIATLVVAAVILSDVRATRRVWQPSPPPAAEPPGDPEAVALEVD
jgi:low temperature requirement protein LtrA